MIKIKKNGFTLSEMLITLSVLGLLGILVLPGLIKDTTSKASITLLQSTVSNINDSIQNEIVRTRATLLADTEFDINPEKFFKDKLETIATSSNGSNFPTEYKNTDGEKVNLTECEASAILKNGVSLCKSKSSANSTKVIYIDINGYNPPNISGVDLFGVGIMHENTNDGKHIGDVGSFSSVYTDDKSKCTSETNYRVPIFCYTLLEASGFDHNYLNK